MNLWKLVQMGRYLSNVLKQCKIITGPSYKNGSVPGHSCCYLIKGVISLLWGTLVLSTKTFDTFYYLATFMLFKIKLTSRNEEIYVLIIYLLKIQIFSPLIWIKSTIQCEIYITPHINLGWYWSLGLIGDVIQILPCIILCTFQEIPQKAEETAS